jgi:beta-phosphoglucomutase-like phosphatase (HAD superfamily)
LKAIFVDLDGTLVNSHAANITAYTTAIAETGILFDTHLLEQTVGRLAWPEMLARVLPGRTELYAAIIMRKREIYAGLLDMVAVNNMLFEFLCAFHNRVPIGLVTSASRISVDSIMRAKSLDSFFSIIVTSDDVEKRKPDPEPYRLAGALLGVEPSDCLIIEDSDEGVAAAKAFGAQVWRVDCWRGS